MPFFLLSDADHFYHMRHFHGILGIMVVIATVLIQPIIGTVDDRYPEENEREKLKKHSIIGRIIYLVSLFVIYLGIVLLRPPSIFFVTPTEIRIYNWIEVKIKIPFQFCFVFTFFL